MTGSPSVLFVCLGNICRSPMAEAALRKAAHDAGVRLDIDSAGTGHWHVGNPPDPRAQDAALRGGVDIAHLRARQVESADFSRFTHIFALDRDNLRTLRRMAPANSTARIGLLLDCVEGRTGEAVTDPYYGDEEGFDTTWRDVTEAAQALLAGFSS